MEAIRLVAVGGQQKEVLEGIGPDVFCITDAMVEATDGNMRIFPHIVIKIADNIARSKELNPDERLQTMRLMRDGLLAAISTRNGAINGIMELTTSGMT